jgi:hypothetical protein
MLLFGSGLVLLGVTGEGFRIALKRALPNTIMHLSCARGEFTRRGSYYKEFQAEVLTNLQSVDWYKTIHRYNKSVTVFRAVFGFVTQNGIDLCHVDTMLCYRYKKCYSPHIHLRSTYQSPYIKYYI